MESHLLQDSAIFWRLAPKHVPQTLLPSPVPTLQSFHWTTAGVPQFLCLLKPSSCFLSVRLEKENGNFTQNLAVNWANLTPFSGLKSSFRLKQTYFLLAVWIGNKSTNLLEENWQDVQLHTPTVPRTFPDQICKTNNSRWCGLMCCLRVWGRPELDLLHCLQGLPQRYPPHSLRDSMVSFPFLTPVPFPGGTLTFPSTFPSWFMHSISGLYCPKETMSNFPLTLSLEGKSGTR